MSKANRLYKTFMTSMIVIIAGMLLATGIIAIQKQIKLKANIEFLPGVDVEIYVKNADNPTETLIFRNFEDTGNSKTIEFNATYCELSATTLTMNNNFVTAYGNNFTLIVKNYSGFTIETNITSTATAKIGENSVNAVPAEITPPTAQIETGESGEFVISCEPIIPQETILTLTFAEYVPPTSWEEDGYTIYTYGTEGAVDDNRAYYAKGSHYKYYIEMGEYPQTMVSSADVTSLGLSTNLQKEGDYYKQGDNYYAYVEAPHSTYASGFTQWYKVEPIRWIVLGGVTSTTDGSSAVAFNPTNDVTYNSTNKTFTYSGTVYSKVLLIAEQALINNVYDSSTSDQPWQDTDIYNFLNTGDTSLLNKIFTQTQKAKILGTTLYTGRLSAGGTRGGLPTGAEGTSENNKLFLLADGDASEYDSDYTKENYKVGDYFIDQLARYGGTEEPNVTEYARASGAYWYNNYKSSYWWLRSGEDSSNDGACGVNLDGPVFVYYVCDNYFAVRPSFVLNLA